MSFIHEWVDVAPAFLHGLATSVEVTLASLVVGVPGGLLLAVGVMSPRRIVRVPLLTVVEIGRGMPALLVLELVYFGLPSEGLTLSSFAATVVALGFNTAAYTSEYIRGGLQSVPHGEIEAAMALNLTRRDTLIHILIPEGMRVALPPVLGVAILIFQATSLAFSIGLSELMNQASSAAAVTLHYMSLFVFAGLLYAVVTIPASHLTSLLERRLSRHLNPAIRTT